MSSLGYVLNSLLLLVDMGGLAAGIVFGLVGLGATIGMGLAVFKANDAISRQPSAEGKIRTTLMIGLAFIETIAIYAILIVILLLIL